MAQVFVNEGHVKETVVASLGTADDGILLLHQYYVCTRSLLCQAVTEFCVCVRMQMSTECFSVYFQ